MKRSNYLKILGVALVMVVSIGIAYAALSATLTVTTNKVTQNALTWAITMSCSKTNDVGTSTTGRSCGEVRSSTNGTTAVIIEDTTLSKPEDGCVYKCTITNSGTIGARINPTNGIVPTSPTSTTCTNTTASSSATAKMVCGNITYGIYASATVSGTTITTTNQTIPSTGVAIAAGGTKDVYLVVQYTGSGVNSSAVTQSGGKFTFNIGQA